MIFFYQVFSADLHIESLDCKKEKRIGFFKMRSLEKIKFGGYSHESFTNDTKIG